MLIFSISLGYFFIYLISISLFKKVNFEYLLISLFISISPIPFLAYTNAWLIKYYILSLFLVVLILNTFKLIKKNQFNFKYLLFKIKKTFNLNWIIILFSLIITFLLTYKFLPNQYRFDSHDLLYFSWLNDIFNIDYDGPIRLPTAFPYKLSANHLTAGSLIAPFLIIVKNPNLYSSYIIKYSLIFFSFLNFNYQFLSQINVKSINRNIKNIIKGSIFLSFLFLFYISEIDYSLTMSNYPLILLILTLSSIIIKHPELKKGELNLLLILVAYCSLVVKAPIFLSLLAAFTFFILSFKIKSTIHFFSEVNPKILFLVFLMLFLNFLSWVIPISNHGTIELSFPFCLINKNNNEAINSCILSLAKNPLAGWYVRGFKFDLLDKILKIKPVVEFSYIWFICLIPCLISSNLCIKFCKSKIFKNLGQFIFCYVLASAGSIVFLRDSLLISGAHTAHLYLIAPTFTVISFLTLYLNNKFEHKNLNPYSSLIYLSLFIGVLLLQISPNSSLNNKLLDFKQGSITGDGGLSLSYAESREFDKNLCTKNKNLINKFGLLLDSNGCGNADIGEIKAGLEGRRTDISTYSNKSLIKKWSLKPENQK